MTTKSRGSEKMLFSCDKQGKRSLADFENVEEALQASGGFDFYKPFPLGKPWPEIMMKQPNILTSPLVTHDLTSAKQMLNR